MARIQTYDLDTIITSNDIVLGSDGDNNQRTKNYLVQSLKEFIIGGQGPEIGGNLRITEVIGDTGENLPTTIINGLDPIYNAAPYELLIITCDNKEVYVCKLNNRDFGFSETPTLITDYIKIFSRTSIIEGDNVSITGDGLTVPYTINSDDPPVIYDATTLIKGIVKLAGDLGGTADLPTVPALASKAPLASPTFTGVPSAPTATQGTSTTQIATTAFVEDAVSEIDSNNVKLTGLQTITGPKIFNTDTGNNPISINLTGISFGISVVTGITANGGFLCVTSGTSMGFIANSTGTGFIYVGQNDGTNTFTVDKLGNIIANTFVKLGGTSSQYLMADGSVTSQATVIRPTNIGWFSGLNVGTVSSLTTFGDINTAVTTSTPGGINSIVLVTMANAMASMNYYVVSLLESLSGSIDVDNDITTPVFRKVSTTQFELGFRELGGLQTQNLKVHLQVISY